MASQFVGINRGQQEPSVVTGTSTQSTDLEIRIDLTKHFSVQDIDIAIDQVRQYIHEHMNLFPI